MGETCSPDEGQSPYINSVTVNTIYIRALVPGSYVTGQTGSGDHCTGAHTMPAT
jgi:hypothetical protein